MLKYILKRILLMIPVSFIISAFVFFLIQLPPGSFLHTKISIMEAQGATISPAEIEQFKQQFGYDQPIYIQYLKWIKGFPQLNFGPAFSYDGKNTWDVISYYFQNTILLALLTQCIVLLLGIPIGIYSATHKYSWKDYTITFLGFIGISIPGFLLALVLMFVGYKYLNIPGIGGFFSRQFESAPWSIPKLLDLLKHLWIPVLVLGAGGLASNIRVMRGNLLDVLNMHYVQTARSKGLSERDVIYRHAVPNALAPIIMGIGMWLPEILSGATIISMVLSLPTMGPILVAALKNQDMYLAGTILLLQCILLLFGNLIADILLFLVDPRVNFE